MREQRPRPETKETLDMWNKIWKNMQPDFIMGVDPYKEDPDIKANIHKIYDKGLLQYLFNYKPSTPNKPNKTMGVRLKTEKAVTTTIKDMKVGKLYLYCDSIILKTKGNIIINISNGCALTPYELFQIRELQPGELIEVI